jgi:excisionase family DNA binding protein
MKQKETLLTTEQVCAYFQISRATLHRWRKKRKVKAVKIDGTVRFKFSDIEKSIK